MHICNNCGVELEDDMPDCPLCGERVIGNSGRPAPAQNREKAFRFSEAMSQPQKKFTWEIVSIILLSGIIATFIIDFIINKKITWSEYPVAISLAIFSYVSLFAFWQQRTINQIAGGFVISSFFLAGLDFLTGGTRWAIALGIPLLLAGNIIIIGLIAVIRLAKHKGINLIAYGFLAAAILCICVEGILTVFKTGALHIAWSVIVAGCILPVTIVLLFVNLRLKKGRSLERTFHV